MEEHTGSIIGFLPELPDDLTVPGGESPGELHVTLVYLTDDHTTLSAEHRAAIGAVIREHAAAIEAPIVGVRTLGDDEPAATVLLLDSPELQELRPVIRQAMVDAGVPVPEDRFPSYIPHITVGYGTPLDDAGHLVGQRVTLATLAAWYGPERDEVYRTATVQEGEGRMATWTAVLARLGTPTGDGRIIAPGGVTHRALPLPLMWQPATSMGHDGAVVVGRIDGIDFSPDGAVIGRGALLDVPEAAQARELIDNGVIGPSVDLDDTTAVVDEDGLTVITEGRISGATLVPIPAFAEVSITLDASAGAVADDAPAALVAAVPVLEELPPAAWFANPQLPESTPLTVTAEGRVFGHIAPWDTCYVGLPGCTSAPRSPSGYAYFLTHGQRTAEGDTVPVGVLSVGEGHAPLRASYAAAMRHYEDVATVAARVMVGEDEFGIWCAGALVPGLDDVLLDRFVSSPLSGDWRPIGGALELIAACSVNTPGFPIPRGRAAAAFATGEELVSLVAALGAPRRGEMPPEADEERSTGSAARARWAWTNNRKGVA